MVAMSNTIREKTSKINASLAEARSAEIDMNFNRDIQGANMLRMNYGRRLVQVIFDVESALASEFSKDEVDALFVSMGYPPMGKAKTIEYAYAMFKGKGDDKCLSDSSNGD